MGIYSAEFYIVEGRVKKSEATLFYTFGTPCAIHLKLSNKVITQFREDTSKGQLLSKEVLQGWRPEYVEVEQKEFHKLLDKFRIDPHEEIRQVTYSREIWHWELIKQIQQRW